MRTMKHKFFLLCLSLAASIQGYGQPVFEWMEDVGSKSYPENKKVYNVSDYGAEGNAILLCTESIQKAIDECAANGGGVVTFNPGIYLTGSLFIKNNVDFNIPKGTMLIGSHDINDYQRIDTRVAGIEMNWPSAILNIIGQKNAAISGDGTVNGRGKPFWEKYREMRKEYDPKGLRWIVDYDAERIRGVLISESSDITVKDIVIYQPAFWSMHILYSEHVTVDGVTISNNIEGRGPSTDGIDIDSSRKILVQNCYIDCNDDNFCLKAGRDWDGQRVNRPTEYIVLRDCITKHGDGLFTCGSETSGSIRHVVAYNMKGIGTKYGFRFKSTPQRGGIVEDIHFYNIEMTGVRDPFIVDLNWHPSYSNTKLPEGYTEETLPPHWKKMLMDVDPEKGMPKFRNIFFENVTVTNARICIKVNGIEPSTIDNFNFKNVSFQGKTAGNISYAKNWTFDNFTLKADTGTLTLKNNIGVEIPQ